MMNNWSVGFDGVGYLRWRIDFMDGWRDVLGVEKLVW
jgi:hypothetical protein